jgi:RNA polymerase sigma-70 factor (ECF subfamily)
METVADAPVLDDDQALLQRAAQGDLAAFDQMMRRYNQRLYRAARAVLHDDMEAEDAVQEAWWKAYVHLRDFRGQAQPATWLTRIAVNEALMIARRHRSRAARIQLTDSGHLAGDLMNPDDSAPAMPASDQPDQLTWRAELRGLIERQIDALPEKYRSVFMLRGVEEMSSAEVADVLGIPEITVRVRYMRARQMLQNSLQGSIDQHIGEAFSFAGARCDRIVAGVHARLRKAGITGS